MTKTIKQLSEEIDRIIESINLDLQTSNLKVSPFQKVASVASGIALGLVPGASEEIAGAAAQERLAAEIAALANLTTAEVRNFYQTHPYSLELIKAAIQAGAKLNEEDIKRTMEERVTYHWNRLTGEVAYTDITLGETLKNTTVPSEEPQRTPTDILDMVGESLNKEWKLFPDNASIGILKGSTIAQYTFVVTFPDGDRREVKAAYMEVDGGSLYFEDDNRETILAYGPGHWVWATRKEDTEEST